MQIAHATPLLRSSGVIERAQSRVNMNATAFKILSSGLYSDKVGAVLREIGCNAADAHIMAGKPDLPFQVKLPTTLSPTFSIKDWGPGLSHDEVMQNYQTYFHSTKTQSNDVTGCFGLGSKSPYAYTDQFTVIAAQDGVMRTYFCAFDETGVPTTSLVAETQAPDSWRNGLEVSLPVPPADFSLFAQKAQDFYQWFRVAPTIVGGTQIQVPELEWQLGFLKKQKDVRRSNPMLVMGNVAYPFNHRILNDDLTAEFIHLNMVLHHIYMQDLVFEVPIGTVDVTASRESVEYTPRTKRALLEWIDNGMRAISSEIDGELRKHSRLTTKSIVSVFEALGARPAIEIVTKMEAAITKFLPADLHPVWETITSGSVEFEGWRDVVHDLDASSRPLGQVWFRQDGRRKSMGFTGHVPVDGRHEVVVNDFAKRAADRVREFTMAGADAGRRVIYFQPKTQAQLQDICSRLEMNPIPIEYTLTNQLPKPPTKVRGASFGSARRGEEKEVNTFVVGISTPVSSTGAYEPPTRAIKDIPAGERYFIVRHSAGWGKRYITMPITKEDGRPRYIYNALNNLKTAGLPFPAYLVITTEKESERLTEKFGFKPLDSWIRNVLLQDPRIQAYTTRQATVAAVRYDEYSDCCFTKLLFTAGKDKNKEWTKAKTALAGTEYITKITALVSQYKTAVQQRAADRTSQQAGLPTDALETLGINRMPAVSSIVDYNQHVAALEAEYPLLRTLNYSDFFRYERFTDEQQDFFFKAAAMAVSPPAPTITPTAQED